MPHVQGMDNIEAADDGKQVSTVEGADGEAAPMKPAKRTRGREGWEVLQHLPHYLRNEVLCHVNGEIMNKGWPPLRLFAHLFCLLYACADFCLCCFL
jgi:hypothetical protein